jgi:hypothetical protein
MRSNPELKLRRIASSDYLPYRNSSHEYFSAEKSRYPDSARQLPSLKSYMYSFFNLSHFDYLSACTRRQTKRSRSFIWVTYNFLLKIYAYPDSFTFVQSVFELGSQPKLNPTQISTCKDIQKITNNYILCMKCFKF